jgi:hypothetical protein
LIDRFRKLVSVLLLIGFGLGCAALALEFGVRLLIPVSDFFWQSDPVTGVKLAANKRGRFVRAGLFDVQIKTNSHGFHDREHTYEKSVGMKRVVILGDSYMEALQVRFDSSLAALLQKQLRNRSVSVETINLGVSAFGTGREYLMLREYGVKYRPDVVLLFFVGNDLINNSFRLEGTPYVPYPLLDRNQKLARDAAGEPRFTPIHDPRSQVASLTNFLKDYSKAYALLRATIERAPRIHELFFRVGIMASPAVAGAPSRGSLGLFEIYKTEESDALRESWMLTENLLLEIKLLTEKQGARFGVVLVPAPWEVYPRIWQSILDRVPTMRQVSLDLDKPSRRLTSFLESQGVAYVDLLPGFRQRIADSPNLFFHPDNHWTAAGHQLATDLVVDVVASMLKDSLPQRR